MIKIISSDMFWLFFIWSKIPNDKHSPTAIECYGFEFRTFMWFTNKYFLFVCFLVTLNCSYKFIHTWHWQYCPHRQMANKRRDQITHRKSSSSCRPASISGAWFNLADYERKSLRWVYHHVCSLAPVGYRSLLLCFNYNNMTTFMFTVLILR